MVEIVKKINIKKIIPIIVCIALALICVGYGLSIKRAGYGTSFFIVWEAIGVFFLTVALVVGLGLWKRFPKWFRALIIVGISLGLAVFIFVEFLICTEFNAKGKKDLDYIIVLGALVYEDRPSSILAARLDSAIEYLNENPKTMCIVSGGQGSNEPFSEAYGMKRYLLQKGIPEERILMEDQSENTIQNIVNCKEIIGDMNASVGVVTSNFHVYRALKLAKKQGYKNVCGISAEVVPYYIPSNMLREFFGVAKDTLKGNM